MGKAAIWIMVIYTLLQAGIVYYFFIYKQNKIDKEYREQLDRIRRSYSHPPRKER
jgi:preprotein translocase subunit YajC